MTAGIQIEFDEVEANFTIVPNQVIYNRDLSSDARFLWLYLRSHKVGYALGYRQMSLELGWSEVTVRKHLTALKDAGLVDVQPSRDGSRNGKLSIRLLLNPQPIIFEGSKSEGSKSMGLNKTKEPNKTKNLTNTLSRATRIPEDFTPTTEMLEWAQEVRPDLDAKLSTEKFKNYWESKSTGATKLDWGKTWRNWILNERKIPQPTYRMTWADQSKAEIEALRAKYAAEEEEKGNE